VGGENLALQTLSHRRSLPIPDPEAPAPRSQRASIARGSNSAWRTPTADAETLGDLLEA